MHKKMFNKQNLFIEHFNIKKSNEGDINETLLSNYFIRIVSMTLVSYDVAFLISFKY